MKNIIFTQVLLFCRLKFLKELLQLKILMEMDFLFRTSHRSKDFEAVMVEFVNLLKELFGIGDEYAVLFLTGGASSQFYMIPITYKMGRKRLISTQVFGLLEPQQLVYSGIPEVIASSEEDQFRHIPCNYSIPVDAAYFKILLQITQFMVRNIIFTKFADTYGLRYVFRFIQQTC